VSFRVSDTSFQKKSNAVIFSWQSMLGKVGFLLISPQFSTFNIKNEEIRYLTR
jgi:hypothetical protein